MELFKKNNKGFTLIEMMISMSIFVIFTGILIGSYTGIVQSQREANQYRELYSNARYIMDKFTEEVRDGAVYYELSKEGVVNNQFKTSVYSLILLSKDGKDSVCFGYDNDKVRFLERKSTEQKSYTLNSENIVVKNFEMFVSPASDPYDSVNVFADTLQFQPKVTLKLTLEKDRGVKDPYEVSFTTTVSSRIYQSIKPVDNSLIVNCNE